MFILMETIRINKQHLKHYYLIIEVNNDYGVQTDLTLNS